MSTVYATEPNPSGRIVLETTQGPLDLELWCRECPTATRFLLQLVTDGFYDNIIFHRILPNTLIQCGAIRVRDDDDNDDDSKKNTTTATTTTKKRKAGYTNLTVTAATATSSETTYNNDSGSNHSMWHSTYYPSYSHGVRAMERQRHELNSRLKFRHRGLVAMALPIITDDNGKKTVDDGYEDHDNDARRVLHPQFFITLEETPYLDGKHVIVGRIAQTARGSPTIFNALRIGRTETASMDDDNDNDENDGTPKIGDRSEEYYREAPRILNAKIVENPIHSNLKPTPDHLIPWKKQQRDEQQQLKTGQNDQKSSQKRRRRKGKLDVNVLSFGDELEEEEDDTPLGSRTNDSGTSRKQKRGIQSIHETQEQQKNSNKRVEEPTSDKMQQPELHPKTTNKNETQQHNASDTKTVSETTNNKSETLESNNNKPEKPPTPQPPTIIPPQENKQEEEARKSKSSSLSSTSLNKMMTKPSKKKLDGASLLQAMRNKSSFSSAKARLPSRNQRNDAENSSSSSSILSKLQAFQSRMSNPTTTTTTDSAPSNTNDTDNSLAARMARRMERQVQEEEDESSKNRRENVEAYHGQVLEHHRNNNNDATTASSWMRTEFKCRKHMDLDLQQGGDGRRTDDYEVVDDRERKQKSSSFSSKTSRRK